MPLRQSYPFHRYLLWAFSETPLGRWRREFVIEPLLYLGKRIHWRNYEAGYDVAELEPGSRANSTYVLLEYFVPIGKFMEFAVRLAEIFKRHRVMVMNISIRHANADPGTLLAWAREEVFAFVVYYKQGVTEVDRIRVGVWNRELIDAVISVGGTYYLPYQPHATSEQFHRAYPGAKKLFDLKARLDPDNRFRNAIWDKYYQPTRNETMSTTPSEFKTVFNDTSMKDGFYRFLQVVFHLYPEDRFHHLIAETCKSGNGDSDIYNSVQERLPEIKTFLSELTYALPALRKQKREMTRQTLKLLGDRKQINGYLEIGSTGRYISDLRKHVRVSGEIFLINDVAPDNSIGEIFERGQISRLGTFLDLAEYAPIDAGGIPDASIDLATCFIGFHHCPEEKLEAFVKSIARALRPGGSLIVRDHNVKSKDMATFVSLVHTVFNLGLGIPWDTNSKEYRSFRSIDDWCKYICGLGFTDSGERLYQENDPSDNALVILTKN